MITAATQSYSWRYLAGRRLSANPSFIEPDVVCMEYRSRSFSLSFTAGTFLQDLYEMTLRQLSLKPLMAHNELLVHGSFIFITELKI